MSVKWLAAMALLALSAAPVAGAKPKIFPGIVVDLKTQDGWTLKAKYSPSRGGGLGFVLLHGAGGRKEDWYYLARPLFRRGYAYVAVDLRGHGESVTAPDGQPANWRKFKISKMDNEFANMIRDVEASVAYLVSQGIPEEKIVIVGAAVGGSVGLKYAATHPKIPMIALLSPGMKYQEVTTVNAMRAYKDRPILMIYSEADRTSSKETPILQAFARGSVGDRKVSVVIVPRENGTRMLRGPVIGQIFDWIANPVRPEVVVSTAATMLRVDASTQSEDEDGDFESPIVQ